MLKRRVVLVPVALGVMLVGAGPVGATIDNVKSFKLAYPGKEPKAYSCKVCHNGVMGRKGDLNAYGLALQKHKTPTDAKKLTEEDYRAIEQEDSDGDGASNLDEINAGTAPGDPASVPKSAGAAPPEQPKVDSQARTEGEPSKGPQPSSGEKGGGK